MKKKKKVELKDGERLETPFEVFMRNYKEAPGFRLLLKLGVYFILIFTIIIVTALNQDKIQSENKTTTTTTTEKVVDYRSSLDDLANQTRRIDIEVTSNGIKYHLNYTSDIELIEGYIETDEGQHLFRLKDNKIYEIVMKKEKENNELFNNLNIDYIIPSNLVDILKNNLATKTIYKDNVLYRYTIKEDKIELFLEDDIIKKININGNNYNYVINYN